MTLSINRSALVMHSSERMHALINDIAAYPEFLPWAAAARIRSVTPQGDGTDEMLADIKEKTKNGDKYLPEFPVEVIDEQGDVVVRVNKGLYIRRKPSKPI